MGTVERVAKMLSGAEESEDFKPSPKERRIKTRMLDSDASMLAAHAGVSLEEAVKLSIDASRGDAKAKDAFRSARIARKQEARVRKLSETMSISLEEARDLDSRALDGDAAAIDAIRVANQRKKEASAK